MRTVAGFCLLATEQPALRRKDIYIGFYTERERLFVDAQKALQEPPQKAWDNQRKNDCSYCNSIPLRREKQQTVSDEVKVVMKSPPALAFFTNKYCVVVCELG